MIEQRVGDMAMKAAEEGSKAVQRTADLMPDVLQKLEVATVAMTIMWLTFESVMQESPETRAIFNRTYALVKAADVQGRHA